MFQSLQMDFCTILNKCKLMVAWWEEQMCIEKSITKEYAFENN